MNSILQQMATTPLTELGNTLLISDDSGVALVAYDNRTQDYLVIRYNQHNYPEFWTSAGNKPLYEFTDEIATDFEGWIVEKNNLGLSVTENNEVLGPRTPDGSEGQEG